MGIIKNKEAFISLLKPGMKFVYQDELVAMEYLVDEITNGRAYGHVVSYQNNYLSNCYHIIPELKEKHELSWNDDAYVAYQISGEVYVSEAAIQHEIEQEEIKWMGLKEEREELPFA